MKAWIKSSIERVATLQLNLSGEARDQWSKLSLLWTCGIALVAAFNDRLVMAGVGLATIIAQIAIHHGLRWPRRKRRGAPLRIPRSKR